MAVAKNSGQQAAAARRTATRAAGPWVEWLARLGYAAKGVVYVVIGILAVQAAQGAGDPNIDKSAALLKILNNPYGHILMIVLAIGFFGYAVWRLIEASMDPERAGRKKDGLLKRAGWAIAGISYAILCLGAARLAMGTGQPGNNSTQVRDFTARAMNFPAGRWLVVLVGLILIGAGIMEFYQAYTGRFERNFKPGVLAGEQRAWAIRLGRAGYSARGVVFTLVGIFLVQAGLERNAQRAGGLGDALAALARQPYGSIVLGVVAIGLLSYGLYAFVLATYRKIYLR